MLDTDILRTFVAVADTGSFTKAGEAVGRTQSAVSMQIKKLEDQLGKQLVVREKKRVILTHEGRLLLKNGRQLLRLSDETVAAIKEPEMSGIVRIGMPDDYAWSWMPVIFREFAETHPNIEFEMLCDTSSSIIEKTKSSELDIAVVTSGHGADDRRVARNESVVWVKASGSTVETLDPLPLAVFQPDCLFRKWAIEHLERTARPYRIAYSSQNYSGIVGAILAGLAVSPLAISSLQPGMEIISPAAGLPTMFDTSIVVQEKPNASALIIRIADHIVASLSHYQPPFTIEAQRVLGPVSNRVTLGCA